ncbi:hypothetical protein B4U80_05319 [Leptotrombidium deliense]|uniref:GRAM domain-containing protein n=1 Tax=Leptotrombidium deliense TaxID=299467 RepID=A0A443SIV7_9ACAR|nr:hypothetical protein B4U80_05319 [Leptotrombidium deliense]
MEMNNFSCALLADILLQGYLYISDNYFGFYSNIFGYKTKLLIPISEVIAITREKTVKIIPNAVGIGTSEGKYVFGSLISRKTTYRVMHDVWSKSISMGPSPRDLPKIITCESVDTGSESPSTPPTGEPDLKCNGNHIEKRLSKVMVLPFDNSGGFSSKSNSLKRNRTLSPHHHLYRRNSEFTDTESDDMHSADDESVKEEKIVLKSFTKSRRRKVQEYVFSVVKNLSLKADSKSLLLCGIIVTLILLVISAALVLYKVNNIHNYLSFFSPHKTPSKAFYSSEMQRINDELKSKLVELTRLKQLLNDLLTSIDNMNPSLKDVSLVIVCLKFKS